MSDVDPDGPIAAPLAKPSERKSTEALKASLATMKPPGIGGGPPPGLEALLAKRRQQSGSEDNERNNNVVINGGSKDKSKTESESSEVGKAQRSGGDDKIGEVFEDRAEKETKPAKNSQQKGNRISMMQAGLNFNPMSLRPPGFTPPTSPRRSEATPPQSPVNSYSSAPLDLNSPPPATHVKSLLSNDAAKSRARIMAPRKPPTRNQRKKPASPQPDLDSADPVESSLRSETSGIENSAEETMAQSGDGTNAAGDTANATNSADDIEDLPTSDESKGISAGET